MSTFSAINLSSRALAAAQRGLEVSGQNIANANTEGYTRQRVEQTSSVVPSTGQWSQRNVTGDGVEITGIARINDALADAAVRSDAATAAEQQATSRVWTDVEANLGDLGTSGLSAQLTDMHKAWGDLVSATDDTATATARSTVIARSQAVASTVNSLDADLRAQWKGLVDQAGTVVEEANTVATRVAGLNKSIMEAASTGASANELIDQRDAALTRLAELTGARVVNRDHGGVDVYVGNAAIVTGTTAQSLTVTTTPTFDEAKAGTKSLTFAVDGVPALPVAGTLKATTDAVNTTVPGISKDLDAIATKIGAQVNALYNPGGSGTDFFTVPTSDAAAGLRVNAAVTPSNFTDSTAGTVDRSVARAISELPSASTSASAAWRGTVVDIATKAQAADVRAELSAQAAASSTAARESISGVNIDEEMTSLVAYQHAYAAAARVLTTIDQALDTLINRTGLVGR
ncbi:flagellar hook-associated protein FlgK [Kineococcus glutinatus]|uniref:Flagellar hook-associated protein 1 n=1 Tax=Kineococcus glutinatus TaxID=1070872 RepID=A0ABP9HWJ4_9ACTN